MINKLFGIIKEPLKKIGAIGLRVAKFGIQNHQYIAPLLHSVSMASGNQQAQKISGGLLALSQMATMHQQRNAANTKIQTEMNKGGSGIYNHATGKMSNYG